MAGNAARVVLLGLVAVLGTTRAFAQELRLNVLFIISDDLSAARLGTYGNPWAHTPNLDRLASMGVRFDRQYANYPLCSPSRASLFYGRRPDATQVFDNADPVRQGLATEPFWPEVLMQNGYHGARAGKALHGDLEPGAIVWPAFWPSAQSWPAIGEGHDPHVTDFLLPRLLAPQEPFLLVAGYRSPHEPYTTDPQYLNMFAGEIPLPYFPPDDLLDVPPGAYLNLVSNYDQVARLLTLREYYASLAKLDHEVGRLMDALDSADLWDRTLVIFTSDNGFALFEHGVREKRMFWDIVQRIPLIVVGPGISPRVVDKTTEPVDLYPTILALTGLASPTPLDGNSLHKILGGGNAKKWKKGVASQLEVIGGLDEVGVNRTARAIVGRVGGRLYRYTKWKGVGKGKELYDLDADPEEFQNLANTPIAKDIINKLQELVP